MSHTGGFVVLYVEPHACTAVLAQVELLPLNVGHPICLWMRRSAASAPLYWSVAVGLEPRYWAAVRAAVSVTFWRPRLLWVCRLRSTARAVAPRSSVTAMATMGTTWPRSRRRRVEFMLTDPV